MTIQAQLGPRRASGTQHRDDRKKLRLTTVGKTGKRGTAEVLIHDLSTGGMLMETQAPLSLGDQIEVELPRTGIRQARVIWLSGTFFGCEFTEPVPPAAVSAALLSALPMDRTVIPQATERGGQESSFAARLAALRIGRGWTLDELAERLGVSRQAVWYWETGQRVPRANLFQKIAAEFGIVEQQFLAGIPQPTATSNVFEQCKAQIAAHLGISQEAVKITVEL